MSLAKNKARIHTKQRTKGGRIISENKRVLTAVLQTKYSPISTLLRLNAISRREIGCFTQVTLCSVFESSCIVFLGDLFFLIDPLVNKVHKSYPVKLDLPYVVVTSSFSSSHRKQRQDGLVHIFAIAFVGVKIQKQNIK